MKQHGFTLAETLITLVIVGVIAAITVPSLIAKYQEEVLSSKFKKSYSTISRAVNKTYFDIGKVNCFITKDSYIYSDCYNFYNALMNNLQIIKTCTTDSYNNGCIPQYSSYVAETTPSCHGFTNDMLNNKDTALVLNDGSILITYYRIDASRPTFAIDINGKNKPNEWGRDIFPFYITYLPAKGLFVNYKPLSAFQDCAKLVSDRGYSTEKMFMNTYKH